MGCCKGAFPYVIPNTERSEVEGSPCKGKKAGMKAFPLGVSHALCASPRCGVRARRTEVFAIVGKSRDRWRRLSLRRRDRCHEVTDEGSSRATVSLSSPSSPPSAELPPKGKPLVRGDSSRSPLSLALPVQGRVPSEARREGCNGRAHAGKTILQSLRDSSLYTRKPSLMSSRTGRNGKNPAFCERTVYIF